MVAGVQFLYRFHRGLLTDVGTYPCAFGECSCGEESLARAGDCRYFGVYTVLRGIVRGAKREAYAHHFLTPSLVRCVMLALSNKEGLRPTGSCFEDPPCLSRRHVCVISSEAYKKKVLQNPGMRARAKQKLRWPPQGTSARLPCGALQLSKNYYKIPVVKYLGVLQIRTCNQGTPVPCVLTYTLSSFLSRLSISTATFFHNARISFVDAFL